MSFLVNKSSLLMLKLAAAAAILIVLAWQAQSHEAFAELVAGQKQWQYLMLGLLATIIGMVLSFVRWSVIAQAAGIGLSVLEAIRLGAVGFGLSFVGPGAIGGDLFKAVAIARGREGQRAIAATTVFVDRFIGLFAWLLTASMAILAFTIAGAAPGGVAWLVCQATLVATGVAIVLAAVLFIPQIANERLAERLATLPRTGKMLSQLLQAWRHYQNRPSLLAISLILSLIADAVMVVSFYCIALGLPFAAPSLIEHFFIVPINLISSALPLTPFGIGVREGVADLMYQGFGVPPGQGTLIAAGHTVTMIATGGLAVLYYLVERGAGSLMEVQTASPEPKS